MYTSFINVSLLLFLCDTDKWECGVAEGGLCVH